jgi:hypothetical protein
MRSLTIFKPCYLLFSVHLEMISLATCVSLTGEKQNIYRVWVGKPEVKHPLGRRRLERE